LGLVWFPCQKHISRVPASRPRFLGDLKENIDAQTGSPSIDTSSLLSPTFNPKQTVVATLQAESRSDVVTETERIMSNHFRILLAMLIITSLTAYASTSSVDLGSAGAFAVLAASTVTNTGASVLVGDLGVSPGTALTGFGAPAVVIGTIYAGDGVAAQAQTDLTTAYNAAAAASGAVDETGQDLGTLVLTPGVYSFSSSAQLTGTLILNAEGQTDPTFIFQIGSTLTTASNSSVEFINLVGATDSNLFWQVGSSATLGTGTDFAGNILANTSITLDTGANIQCGSALAMTGAVTLDDNSVSVCAGNSTSLPEPSTGSALLLVGAPMLFWLAKRRMPL
jgi:hypothetical protein